LNKLERKEARRLSVGDILFTAFLLLLFFLKFDIFYSGLHLAEFGTCFALISTAMLLALTALISLYSPHQARVTLLVLYLVMSVLLGVDYVYYSYVTKLPSVIQVTVVHQLTNITDMILELIHFKHVLMIIDLPLWLCYAINRRLFRRLTPKLTEKLSHRFLGRFPFIGGSLLALALTTVLIFTTTDFLPEYMENEIFCYHVSDIYTCFFYKEPEKSVEKEQYTGAEPTDEEADPYYGIAEGRNVFIIQVEALQNFVIGASYEGQVLTPNLNALIENDTLYFNNYYYQIGGGNTADAEFSVNNSLFAPEAEAAYFKYTDKDFYGLPKLLKDFGYTGSYVFHGYVGDFWNRETAYVGQGFDDFTSLEDFEETEMFPLGLSDCEFFRQSLDIIKTYEEPFYAFMITVSSHYPYALPLEVRGIEEKEEDVGTLFGLYIQSVNYADRAIGEFIEGLKEAGLYENSVFIIYGDHYALTNTDSAISSKVREMLGSSYTIYDVFNVPMMIHIPGLGEAETVSVAGGHLAAEPTLLYLLGIQNDKAVMFGQNLLTAESGFVCEQAHMSRGSFISDEVLFKKPHNNIKSNYDAYEYGTMERLDPEQFYAQSDYAKKRIEDCEYLIEHNQVLLTDGE